jgi:hypothetical protein
LTTFRRRYVFTRPTAASSLPPDLGRGFGQQVDRPPALLARDLEQRLDAGAAGRHLGPQPGRHADRRDLVDAARRGLQREDAARRESRQHGAKVDADLVEAQPARFGGRVAAVAADGGEVVLPVAPGDRVEAGRALRVGRAHDRVQRERARAVALHRGLDERAERVRTGRPGAVRLRP